VAWTTWQRRAWNELTRAHIATYRLSRGRIGGSVRGAPILLLNHIGRKTGEWRTSPLVYLPDGDDMVVVASRGGSRHHPAWFLNLRDMKETTVEVGGRTEPVSVRVADPEERKRLWPEVVDLYSGYAAYQRRTDREIPLVILSPTD
jgi:deazaflavin-dependent oxidoreductase (nitroreductase family)